MIWFPHKLSQSHSDNKDISFSSYANCPGTSQSSWERYDLETVDQLHMVNSLSQEVPKNWEQNWEQSSIESKYSQSSMRSCYGWPKIECSHLNWYLNWRRILIKWKYLWAFTPKRMSLYSSPLFRHGVLIALGIMTLLWLLIRLWMAMQYLTLISWEMDEEGKSWCIHGCQPLYDCTRDIYSHCSIWVLLTCPWIG